jgi:hypothetical protein
LFLLGIVLGGLVGALFTALTPFDDEDFFMGVVGQREKVVRLVEDHFQARADPTRWDDAYGELGGDQVVEWSRKRFISELRGNPVRAVAPQVKVTELSSEQATVSITGTRWWRRNGCQQFTGTFTVTREGGWWLLGGTWKISAKGGRPRSLTSDAAPEGWDCRSAVKRLRDNERAAALSSVRGSSAITDYPSANTVDDDPSTAWVAGEPTPNGFNWLEMRLASPAQIVRIDVKNGYGSRHGPEWVSYDRAERVLLINDKNEQFIRRLDPNRSGWQRLLVPFSAQTRAVRLYVETHTDCRLGLALSEVRVFVAKKPEPSDLTKVRRQDAGARNPGQPVDCRPPTALSSAPEPR